MGSASSIWISQSLLDFQIIVEQKSNLLNEVWFFLACTIHTIQTFDWEEDDEQLSEIS